MTIIIKSVYYCSYKQTREIQMKNTTETVEKTLELIYLDDLTEEALNDLPKEELAKFLLKMLNKNIFTTELNLIQKAREKKAKLAK